MSASYPTSAKSFTALNAGDTIQDTDVEAAYDEITAVETELVTSGLTNLLKVNAGVKFPATQAVSTDANVLDDYEEGTWTPVLGGSGGTSGQTYTTQAGTYVKVGKLVWATGLIVLSAKGTITTNLQISGLPFTSENTSGNEAALTIGYWANLNTAVTFLTGFLTANATAVLLQGTTAAATTIAGFTTTDVTNTTSLRFSIVYRASA